MKRAVFRRHCQQGFSLIEMLVGILVITFGLLGLLALQSRALIISVGSEDSQRAALLASEMAVIMTNLYTTDLNAQTLQAWTDKVSDPISGGLPNGTGTVTPISAREARIVITWQAVQAASGAANETHTYTTDVVLPQ